MTRVLNDVPDAADRIRRGQIVAFPTETVYGLGANALEETAVARVFEAKQRPSFDPLIVHVPRIDAVLPLVRTFPAGARRLADAFWPGPLTLVLPKQTRIPDLVTAGLPAVGVRIPDHPMALDLLTAAAVPVAAPSANPFGGVSPTTARHVLDGLRGRIDAVLDGGPCRVGVESTVVSFLHDRPQILRPGGISQEMIEALIGPTAAPTMHSDHPSEAPAAPGMLSRHYATNTPVHLFGPSGSPDTIPPGAALLTWGPAESFEADCCCVISCSSSATRVRA